MEGIGFAAREAANLSVLTQEAVKTSAIEGEKLSAEEVRSSLARQLGLEIAGLVPSARNVDGVVEMLLDATRRFELPLSEERLFGWQAGLFPTGWSGTRRIAVGKWRGPESGPMRVVSGAIGRERVHFEAPAAGRVEKEMDDFLRWFNSEEKIDPVLKAGIAHLWFVTIHPFDDGNGRVARAIADMCLARSDGCRERFYSMSAQIEAERKEYYLRLEAQQRGGLDVTAWLEWFVACLSRALARAEESFAEVLRRGAIWKSLEGADLSARQRTVIGRLVEGFEGKLTTSKYAKIAKCSTDTALRDIRELMAAGILVQEAGGGRSTAYSLRALAQKD